MEEEGVRVWTVYVGSEEHGDAVTSLLFDMLGKKTEQGTRQRAAFGRSIELFEIDDEEVVLLTKSAREAADEGRRLDKSKKGKKGRIPARKYDDTSIIHGVRADLGVDDLLGSIADRGTVIAEEVDPRTPAPAWMAEGEAADSGTGKEEWLKRNQGYLRSMLVKSLLYPDGNGGSTIKIQWESKRVAAAMERQLWEVHGRWGDSAMTQRIHRAPKTWLTKDDVDGIRRKKKQAEARKKASEGRARKSAANGSNGDGDWESFQIPKPRPPSPEKNARRGETPTPRPRPRPTSNPRGWREGEPQGEGTGRQPDTEARQQKEQGRSEGRSEADKVREEMQQLLRKQEAAADERERLLQEKLDDLQARYKMRFMNEEDEAHDKAQAEEEKLHYAELLKGMEEKQVHREHEMKEAMEEKMRTMSNELNDKLADLLAMMNADFRGPSQERHQRRPGGQGVRRERGEQAKPKEKAQGQKRASETPESSDYGEYESSDEERRKRHNSQDKGSRRARTSTGTDGNPSSSKRGSMGSVLQGFVARK